MATGYFQDNEDDIKYVSRYTGNPDRRHENLDDEERKELESLRKEKFQRDLDRYIQKKVAEEVTKHLESQRNVRTVPTGSYPEKITGREFNEALRANTNFMHIETKVKELESKNRDLTEEVSRLKKLVEKLILSKTQVHNQVQEQEDRKGHKKNKRDTKRQEDEETDQEESENITEKPEEPDKKKPTGDSQ